MRAEIWLGLVVLLALLGSSGACSVAKNEVPAISIDALKTLLEAPDLLILDVRAPSDWDKSDKKIRGAVRQDPQRVETWGPNLPKNKEIVLYCA